MKMISPSTVNTWRNHREKFQSKKKKRRTPPSNLSPHSGRFRGALLFFYFTVGKIGFLADFLFCVLAFGSFAKISVSRRARVFANVPNQGGTKNMTKKLCAVVIP